MKTFLSAQTLLFGQCHRSRYTNALQRAAPPLVHHSQPRRHFAHKDTLKRLKRTLGLTKQKNSGPKRGAKGRAPGWLSQTELVGPRVAIVGRTNVGKSTLFNKLAGRPVAIADNTAGVTRDRKEAQGRLVDLDFVMVDCPGIEELPPGELKTRKIELSSQEQVLRGMLEQSQFAIQFADVVLFLFDAKVGLQREDRLIAQWLRRKLRLTEVALPDGQGSVMQSQLTRNRPGEQDKDKTEGVAHKLVIGVANKVEDAHAVIASAFELGLGEVVSLSCHSGDGLVDLFHALDDAFTHMDKAKHRRLEHELGALTADAHEQDHHGELEQEELTYIPLSSLHDLQSEHAHRAMAQQKHNKELERELASSLEADAFELRYDPASHDALNEGLGQETPDFDDVGREYAQLRTRQTEADDDGHLSEWEMARYDEMATALTHVAPDDAEVLSLDPEDVDGVEQEQSEEERLRALFELRLCIVSVCILWFANHVLSLVC